MALVKTYAGYCFAVNIYYSCKLKLQITMDRFLPFLAMSAQSRFSALPQLRHSPNFPYVNIHIYILWPCAVYVDFILARDLSVWQEVYRRWLCAVYMPYYGDRAGVGRLQPCRAVCHRVQQVCPFLLPAERAGSSHQYAGEPTFYCEGNRTRCFHTSARDDR